MEPEQKIYDQTVQTVQTTQTISNILMPTNSPLMNNISFQSGSQSRPSPVLLVNNYPSTETNSESKSSMIIGQSSSDLYVVSDSQGFIAAFTSIDKAKKSLEIYLKLDLIWQRFKCQREIKDDDQVFVLSYRNGGHVAFVDIDPDIVRSVQKKLGKVDLVFQDDVSYWAFPVNKISLDGAKRLQIWLSIANGLTDEQKKRLEKNEEVLKQALGSVEKDFDKKPDSTDTNLMDCVISPDNLGELTA
jgi:uncharacterized protein YegJ (DUF2314 family)